MVPYPFSRGLFLYGDPLWVSREADDGALEAARLELETVLNRLTDQAEQEVMCHSLSVTRGPRPGGLGNSSRDV
jgi:hypothetical protein